MAKTQEEKEAEALAKAEAKAAKEAAKAEGAISATVAYQGGERTFTKEIHGEDFMDVAKEFATTHSGTIK